MSLEMLPGKERGEWIYEDHYDRYFEWADHPGSGWSFPCDPDGRVDIDALQPAGRANYEACLSGKTTDGDLIVDKGVRKYTSKYWEPAVGKCMCGSEVVLDNPMTNTCEGCGRDYSGSGTLLAPRSQWGWDTGETADEIISGTPDYNSPDFEGWKKGACDP